MGVGRQHDHEIRAHDVVRDQVAIDVGEDATASLQLDCGVQVIGEGSLNALVVAAGGRAHDDLPVEHFVALAVVGGGSTPRR
jgi:hypothetical protein